MVHLTLDMSDEELDRLKDRAARRGSDVSRYVAEKVRIGMFWDGVDETRQANADLTPEQAEELANAAVDWARAHRS